jgi:hypothetical protein
VALAGPRYPAPSTDEEQVAAWERLIDLTPDRADSWYELGAHLLRLETHAGDTTYRRRALVALQRTLELAPTHGPARELIGELAYASTDVAHPSLPDSTLNDPGLALAPFLRWRAAIANGDTATLRETREGFPQLGPRNLRAIALAAQRDGVGLDDARLAVRQLRTRQGRLADRVDGVLAAHSLALNEGRLRDAFALTARLADLQPAAHAHWRLQVLDVLYGDADSLSAQPAIRALQRSVTARRPDAPRERAVQSADACVLAQWRLARGDTADAARTSEWLREDPIGIAAVAPPVSASPLLCADLIDAALAVLRSPGPAAAATAHLDSLALTSAMSADAIMYVPLFIARLHARAGDANAALQAVQRRNEEAGWPRYLATMLQHEAHYATLAGAPEQARRAYTRYLRLRREPDAALRDQVAKARRALAAPSNRRRR